MVKDGNDLLNRRMTGKILDHILDIQKFYQFSFLKNKNLKPMNFEKVCLLKGSVLNMMINAPEKSTLKKIYDRNFKLRADQLEEKRFLNSDRCILETKFTHFKRFMNSASLLASWFESTKFDDNNFIFYS